ncbi:MAG: hypothetical protein OQK12_01330 [Motiliproteus sp.]|nr:hypothetical protein [Motiliproteus sp.]MCW9051057.1 hypothetical protein [Motiliproteus sp.]
MQNFGIECLIEDAARILAKAGPDYGGCEYLSASECERLHAIHDELVGLECDDVVMLGQIAQCLLPCAGKGIH